MFHKRGKSTGLSQGQLPTSTAEGSQVERRNSMSSQQSSVSKVSEGKPETGKPRAGSVSVAADWEKIDKDKSLQIDPTLAEIAARIVSAKTDIMVPGRVVIRQGPIQRKARWKNVTRWCVLTNEQFIFMKVKDKKENQTGFGQLQLKQVVDLKSVQIDTRTEKKNSMLLKAPDRTYTLFFKDERELLEWQGLIAATARALREKDVKTSEAGLPSQHTVLIGTLHSAALSGDEGLTMRFLSDRTMDINKKDNEGSTALHIATQAGNTRIVKLLLSHSADTSVTNGKGQTALHVAARCGAIDVVKALVQENKANVWACDHSSHSALWIAATEAKEWISEMIQALTSAGSDADTRDPATGLTLLQAVCQMDRAEAAEALLNCSASPTLNDQHGRTALHLAADAGAIDCVKLLIEHGAGPNVRDHQLNTSLHLAKVIEIAVHLLNNGSRPDLLNLEKRRAVNHFEELKDPGHLLKLREARTSYQDRADAMGDHQMSIDEKSWVADVISDTCLLCGDGFTLTKRRHHCRRCGLLVCGACSSKQFLTKETGEEKKMRACDNCYNILTHKQRVEARKRELEKAKEKALAEEKEREEAKEREKEKEKEREKEREKEKLREKEEKLKAKESEAEDEDTSDDEEEDDRESSKSDISRQDSRDSSKRSSVKSPSSDDDNPPPKKPTTTTTTTTTTATHPSKQQQQPDLDSPTPSPDKPMRASSTLPVSTSSIPPSKPTSPAIRDSSGGSKETKTSTTSTTASSSSGSGKDKKDGLFQNFTLRNPLGSSGSSSGGSKPSTKHKSNKTMSDFDRRKFEEEMKIENQLKRIEEQRTVDMARAELQASKHQQNKEALIKRGQKLNETAEKTDQLAMHAGQFLADARKLKEKQKNSWF